MNVAERPLLMPSRSECYLSSVREPKCFRYVDVVILFVTKIDRMDSRVKERGGPSRRQ